MKKKISFAVAFIMLVSSIISNGVFAAFSDVGEDYTYKNAIITLSKLGVIDGYEDGTFKPEGEITRAEFTKIIVSVLGLGNIQSNDNIFTDTGDHWAKYYINTAYNQGIIDGMGDGTFAPDSPVTYEQAQKMVVSTLGYSVNAEAMGGWPSGYTNQAVNLGLCDKISGLAGTSNAPRGSIAQLVYNALDVNMRVRNGSFWQDSEKTLMKDYLKVKKLKGILVGVEEHVTEDCSVKLLNGQMNILADGEENIIDYTTYTESVTDISKYLGNTITIYYRQISDIDEKTLVIIDDETVKNVEMEILSNEVESFSNSTLVYIPKDTTKSRKVNLKLDDLSVRYNGKVVKKTDTVNIGDKSYTWEEALYRWLDPESEDFFYGELKLTDSSSDGVINLLQIYDYETIVALKQPTTTDYKITDKLVTGNNIILKPDSLDYTFTIEKDGREISTTDIKAGDVVLYAKSLDGELYTCQVSSKTVKGTVSSISSDYAYETVTINNVEYRLGEKCKSYIQEKDGKELKIGDEVTFYIDKFDTLVYGTISEVKAEPYGYIVDAEYDEGSEAGYVTVFFTTSTSPKTYQLSNKVKVNGKSMSNSQVLSELEANAKNFNNDGEDVYSKGETAENATYSQLARIEIKDNMISSLVLADSSKNGEQNEDASTIAQSKALGKYKYTSNRFTSTANSSDIVTTNSSTVVIYIPQDRSERDGYAKKTVSSAFVTNNQYFIEAYDINSSKYAKVILAYNMGSTMTTVSRTTDFSVVAATPIDSVNDDDEVRKSISVYSGPSTTTKSWITADQDEFSNCKPGDVIQFDYNDDEISNRINNIKFDDIAEVLDGKVSEVSNGDATVNMKYYWGETQEPSEENNMQSYKFDYRFKKSGTSNDEMYTSDVIYSRACVYNVSQVLPESNKIYVTKNGFAEDGSFNDDDYEEVKITNSTKIIRMESDRKGFSKYAEDTESDLSINDLKGANDYGADCSKILVCTLRGTVRLLVIYA